MTFSKMKCNTLKDLLDGVRRGLVEGERSLVEVQRALPVERRAGTPVEAVGDAIEVGLGMHREVGALGKVLTQQAVGVLAGTALPGAVRVAEIDLHAGLRSEFGVSGHLGAAVIGQALAHRFGDGVELGGKAGQGRGGSGVVHLHQDHQVADALDEHAHRGLLERTLDEVALPVPGQDPVVDVGLAQVDAQRIAQASAVLAGRARPAPAARLAKTGLQLAAQFPARMRVQRVVDRLVREPGAGVVGVHALECGRDLLGPPFPRQYRQHLHPEQRGCSEPVTGMGLRPALPGQRLGATAGIAASSTGVARDLSADSRGRSCQDSGDLADASALLQQAGYRQPVFGLQLAVASRADLHRHKPYLTGASVGGALQV